MKTDDTKARPGCGFYFARHSSRRGLSLLLAALLGAAAFSWGCAGFVAGTNNTNPPPPPTYSISGTISPSAGGSGATVTLSGTSSATITANSSGAYSFTGLANGTYTVAPSHSGYTFSPASQNATVNGANVTGINFTATAVNNTFSVSGTITPTAGGSGATVTLSGAANATTTANSSGAYTFTGLANGTYTVTPSHSGYTFSPASQNATVNGANVTGINFTATAVNNTFSISGTITPTAGGSGATVTLSGAATATTTANSSGAYTFTGLANGSYAVTPSKAGFTFSPTSANATVNGANVTGINFTATANATFSISGTITLSGVGLSGVAVALTGPAVANTTSNTSGNYTFSGLANGTYTVTPSLAGDTFTPASQSVTINGANQTGVNFTATVTVTHTVALAWVASTTTTVTSYNVYRSTSSTSGFQVIGSVSASTVPLAYTDSGVTNGLTYYYQVTAVDSSTGLESTPDGPVPAIIP